MSLLHTKNDAMQTKTLQQDKKQDQCKDTDADADENWVPTFQEASPAENADAFNTQIGDNEHPEYTCEEREGEGQASPESGDRVRGSRWKSFCNHENNGGTGFQQNKNNSSILCANCGGVGHVYRTCSLPTTSFGVICYRWTVDTKTGQRTPQYLMVQRKDSLCFVEFVRGKYDLKNRRYIMQLFDRMTHVERHRISTSQFVDLWGGFWQNEQQNRGYTKEFHKAQEMFNILKQGYYVRCLTSNALDLVSLDTILQRTRCEHDEPEWGFPKGRRNINEKDLKCALREFREETGFDSSHVKLHTEVKPFEEVFTGCNKIRYRHVYYVAQLKQDSEPPLSGNGITDVVLNGDRAQMREISRVAWLTEGEILKRIRRPNSERRKIFKRVHLTVLTAPHLQRVYL